MLSISYIRECYYRIILELLFTDLRMYNSFMPHSVVTGTPGTGKTSLSFLFILVLLELGVNVFIFCLKIYILCRIFLMNYLPLR